MTQRTILVADDDSSIRSLLRQLLADEGYAVALATNGQEALVHLGRQDRAAAVASAREALRLDPDHEGARELLGRLRPSQ